MSPSLKHGNKLQINQNDFPAIESPGPIPPKSRLSTTQRPSSKPLPSGELSMDDDEFWSTWGAPLPRRKRAAKRARPGAATQTKKPPILQLPVELHKDIADILAHSSLLSLLRLRLANNYFRALIPPPSHSLLLSLEQQPWPRSRSLYACKYCVRLRSKQHFADAMLKGRTGLNGKEPEKRFCLDCGFGNSKSQPGSAAQSRYSPGTEVTVSGEKWVWCKSCLEVQKGDEAKGCAGCCGICHSAKACSCGGLDVVRSIKEKKRRGNGGGGGGGHGGVRRGRGGLGRDGFGSGYGYGDFDYVLDEYEEMYGSAEAFWECND